MYRLIQSKYGNSFEYDIIDLATNSITWHGHENLRMVLIGRDSGSYWQPLAGISGNFKDPNHHTTICEFESFDDLEQDYPEYFI